MTITCIEQASSRTVFDQHIFFSVDLSTLQTVYTQELMFSFKTLQKLNVFECAVHYLGQTTLATCKMCVQKVD